MEIRTDSDVSGPGNGEDMSKMFGTDGVRGVANDELTPQLAMQLGQAGAYVLTREHAHKPTIMVGCDTRISGDMLANAIMAGACSVGANCVYVGVMPTPAIAYLTKKYRVDAGVVISASHNPMEFNGIKFFDGDGYKLPDSLEDEIESLIKNNMQGIKFPIGSGVGKVKYRTDAREEYINHAVRNVNPDLSKLKIVVDCAEGASHYTAVEALQELGANVVPIHNMPDGTNINANCGSTHMEEVQAKVVYEKADVGLAFDGDADRLEAVDEEGNIINGDQIMAVVGNYMKNKGTLKKNTIVATVMSNLGFFQMGERNGINIEQTKVGDRYVLERMREIGANLGGEQSGHIIFLDENTTGDGLLSALHLLQVMVDTGEKLSELSRVMEIMPQALVNAKVPNHKKDHYLEYPEIADAIDRLNTEFAGQGRVLIRPSGTEPMVRVMIEGKDQEKIQKEAEKLAGLIQDIMF
jgi:phosphoglucosamine mutase